MAAAEYFILFQEPDGTWCAAPPSFQTSELDPVGRGNTRQAAISNLLRDRECQELIREQGWTEPTRFDFSPDAMVHSPGLSQVTGVADRDATTCPKLWSFLGLSQVTGSADRSAYRRVQGYGRF
jgi:hypothetical protein